MPISALPTPPSRSDSPQDFSDRADALLGALPGFVTEANALQSDVNAKESAASSSATIATNKASEAQASANTANTKASEAAASAIAAAAAASNAEIAFDSFDDKYLGSKASDPTTDNDGNALLVGALYWNTTVGAVRVWNGAAWLSMAADASIVDFQQAGAGAVVRTAQDKMRECVSVKDFGAAGDGVADDTEAIQSAIDFVVGSGGGEVLLPSGIYKITDTLVLDTGLYLVGVSLRGAGRNTTIRQVGAGKDAIHFSATQFLQNSYIRDLRIETVVTAGHCINILYGCTVCFFDNLELISGNPAKSCFYGDYSTFGGGIYDTKFRGGTWYMQTGSTVPGFKVICNGTIFNENVFENLRVYNAHTVQFFHITTVTSGSVWLINNTWKNINFEVCRGGGILFDSFKCCTFQGLSFWDAGGSPYVNHLIDMVAGAGYESRANTFISVTRNGDSLAAGVRDIRIVSGEDSVMINCHTQAGDNPSYDFGSKHVTVIGRMPNTINAENAITILPDIFSASVTFANDSFCDTLHIGGRSSPEAATLSYGSGYVQLTPLLNNTGVILNGKNGGGGLDKVVWGASALYPVPDNAASCGASSGRWSVVYSATGTINTSDERAKQQIKPIDSAALKAWSKVQYCQYKMNDAVKEKGENARWHFGLIAQRVKEAFESEGLNAFEYGILCYDKWEGSDAVVAEDGTIVIPAMAAGELYGVRYEEALSMECAYLRSVLLKE